MNFKEFLNETPALIDVPNDPELANRMYEKDKKNKKSLKDWKQGEYEISAYQGKSEYHLYILKDDQLQLFISFTAPNVKGLGQMIQNSYIQKAKGGTVNTAMIIDIIFGIIDTFKFDGIISDDLQSEFGGKKLWRSIMQYGNDKGHDIGIYDNQEHKVEPKEKDKKFALWYAIRSREVYGRDLKFARYQLYVKK